MNQRQDSQERYLSYLLRAWQPDDVEAIETWLFELESIQSGQKVAFANLQALYYYLQERIEAKPESQSLLSSGRGSDTDE